MKKKYFLIILFLIATPAFADTYVATRTIKKGNILNNHDLVKTYTDGEEPRDDIDDLIGNEVRRVIYKGSPIRKTDIGPITVINRNEIVVMNLKIKTMEIKTKGRAMDAGGVGETIRVMNLASRKMINATVKSGQEVEVIR